MQKFHDWISGANIACGDSRFVLVQILSLGTIKDGKFVARYVSGVDHVVAKSDEEMLKNAVTAALNKADEAGLRYVRMHLARLGGRVM